MTGGHKRKRSDSRDDVEHEDDLSLGQPLLQTKIDELIERQKIQHEPDGRSSSENLMRGFIQHIWPELRDDYRQLTQYLEEALKKVLKEQHIHAEVSSRVKDDNSIEKTLKRRQEGLWARRGSGFNSYQDIFHEMHDLSGLRIILMYMDDRCKAQELIERLFKRQKPYAHFDPNREVGQFWKPWFGAYEARNHRVQLPDDNGEAVGDSRQYSGVTFEIQLTTLSENLYNTMAHDLLYKADPGLLNEQEEIVLDLSHGLSRCFELCVRILRSKQHSDTDNMTVVATRDVNEPTEEETQTAQKVVDDFERHLHRQSESDRTAYNLLRKLLSKQEGAEDQACLKDLVVSDPCDDKARIEGMKGGLMPSSHNWILEDLDFQRWREGGQNQLLWITGAPGKGKTMMLCGIINELREQSGTKLSFSFCQGTENRFNTATSVLRGLLFLLCKQQHSLISYIRYDYDRLGAKLFEDPNAWVALSRIFDNILKDLGHTYLVVDALDECLPESRQLLAGLIVQMSRKHPAVKWVVSSRELDEFKTHLSESTQLSLESRRDSVSEVVNVYIDSKVDRLGEKHLSLSEVKTIADELKRKSEGTFLWVSIVCKKLESARGWEVMNILQKMPNGLNELYKKLMQDIKALQWERPTYCQSVLRVVTVAFRPLTLKELQELAQLPPNVPSHDIAEMCSSLLTIRDDTVFFVHQSAKDYLSNKWDSEFHNSIRDTHVSMSSRSVEAMKRVLKQDIYNLRHPGIHIDNIERQRPNPDPLASIRYSCVHWITHFREAQPYSAEDEVRDFLKVHFLHWVEALSLIRSASACVYALRDLTVLFNKGSLSESLLPLIKDMYRFAQTYGAVIQKVPLQAYSSALIFSPACSLTRTLFTSKEPDWIVKTPRVEQHWNSCLATLTGHFDPVYSVDFSPDGHRIVSGSSKGTIKIWDAESGAEILTLQGDADVVWSVAFDEEGKFITSKSNNTVVKTWDLQTGICISTCKGSRKLYNSTILSFGERRRTAYFSAHENNVEIVEGGVDSDGDSDFEEDTNNGSEALTLLGHSKPITSVDLSYDGRLIATASDDRTVKIWDAETGDEIATLQGHTWQVLSVSFSPDARRIASGSEDGTIKIWDVESGTESSTPQDLSSHLDQVTSVALTLDGRCIASGSEDNTVKIWNAKTGDNVRTIKYKLDGGIWSVKFSPDGRHVAAGTLKDTCPFFISGVESKDKVLTCSGPHVGPLALSLDGCYIAFGSGKAITIKKVENDQDVMQLDGHSDVITSLAFSPKDCQIAASSSRDKTIKIWNVVIGVEILTLNMGLPRFDTFLYANSLLSSYDSTSSLNSTSSQTKIVLPQIRQHRYGVNKDCSWITWHGQNILWIPPELRATDYEEMPWDVLPHTISVGCSSGRVWWIAFSLKSQPFAV